MPNTYRTSDEIVAQRLEDGRDVSLWESEEVPTYSLLFCLYCVGVLGIVQAEVCMPTWKL